MTNLENQINDCILEEGLSSKARNLIMENIHHLSSEFLTDILVENVNLYISYLLLIDYLPYVWKEDNSSKNLLNYLSGLAHRLFYLAREYPLGKDIPKNQKEELEKIHSQLCDFMESCLNEDLTPPQATVTDTKSFTELLDNLTKYPKYPHKIHEIFQILASLFYHFALNETQILRDQDELGIFISRCLVFWKLGVMDNEKMITCFEKAAEKYKNPLQPDKFENILALEIQNYQFLQLGINKKQVELITNVFCKLRC
ncbi:MAG: hypothetical protein H7641_15635 [Candidatus Heimdallarchaeota archaeon]|nr:hypothetical protein [Candidatus Heimdallarchaeota archaeon]MCK4878991.1 hypothetical protein [Candidatus Heimdallarchaeota archaeon]